MDGLGVIWVYILSAIFLIPFSIAFFYFIFGLRSFLVGKRESNKSKIVGGYNTMFGAMMAIVAILFFWKIVVWDKWTMPPE